MAESDPIELRVADHLEQVSVPDAEKAAHGIRMRKRLKAVLALAAAKIAIGAGAWMFFPDGSVSTDNAYVAPQSAQGQILLRLDDIDRPSTGGHRERER
jgi:hypothetical protein